MHSCSLLIRLDRLWKAKERCPWLPGSPPTTPLFLKTRRFSTGTILFSAKTIQSLSRKRMPWTETEKEILKQCIAEGLPFAKFPERLPGRTPKACYRYALLFRPTSRGKGRSARSWSIQEDEVIRQWNLEGRHHGSRIERHVEIAKKLPGRSLHSCREREIALQLMKPGAISPWLTRTDTVFKQRIARRRWLPKEEEILKQAWEEGLNIEEIAAKLPGRTAEACAKHITKFKLKRLGRFYMSSSPWSAEEDDILTQGIAQEHGWELIMQKLPGRTRRACLSRCLNRRLLRDQHPRNRWSQLDDRIVAKGISKGLTRNDIALQIPSRNILAIGARMRVHICELGKDDSSQTQEDHDWSTQETNILGQGLAEGLTYEEISAKLEGRSLYACQYHAQYRVDLHMSKLRGVSQTSWSKDEEQILAKGLFDGLTNEQIAERLRRTERACIERMAKLQLFDISGASQKNLQLAWLKEHKNEDREDRKPHRSAGSNASSPKWTSEEREILLKATDNLTNRRLSDSYLLTLGLQRTVKAIRAQLYWMRVMKTKEWEDDGAETVVEKVAETKTTPEQLDNMIGADSMNAAADIEALTRK